MSAHLASLSALEAAVRAAPSLVVLKMPGRQGIGFVASAEGHLITNLHVVASAPELHAQLSDGQLLKVEEVVALDEQRDLAVLHLPPRGISPLQLSSDAFPNEGDVIYALIPGFEGGLGLVESRVQSIQVLGESLIFLEMEATLPENASGGPVLDESGALVGVATCAWADGQPVTIIIPSRYARPLLETPGRHPLSRLAQVKHRVTRQRQVPEHSLSLMEGCSPDAAEAMAMAIMQAIQIGAPAYNRGDVEGCYRLYVRTAELLLRERLDCPGAQQALRQGLQRCAKLTSADERAWALRDTFDGLLAVIDRWLQAQAAFARMAAPKSFLQ